jgi:hypothetical protein
MVTIKSRCLAIALLHLILINAAFAQRSRDASPRSGAPLSAEPNLLASLPASDALALVDVHRLLSEAVPKIFAGDAAKLAEVNSDIDQFKTKTGLNPRSFDQVAVGMRYTYPSPGITKINTVALARGTFDVSSFVAAGKLAANGKYHEERYQAHTIYIFGLDQPIKLFGLMTMRVRELAVCPLSNNVLAIGDPAGLRNVIDAGRVRGGANAELIALATRDRNAMIGFSSNFSPKLIESLKLNNEEMAKEVAAIKQVYGTAVLSEKNVELFIAARITDSDSAKNLGQVLQFFTQLAAFRVNNMKDARGPLARAALNNLKITTQGNELQIRTAVVQADIAPLIRGQ